MLDNATYTKYLDEARSSAMARLGDSPVYDTNSANEQQRKSLMDQVMNREKFRYNINEDGLYNVYRDKYVNQGRMAMRDTMGQAAALTGGYGNSYGQAVGQQAYDRALQSLNDVVPQLYGQALNVYEMEGNQLNTRYGLANDLVGEDWTKYRAAVSDWQTNRALAEQQAEAAAKARYQLEADAYKNLTSMIGATGYVPSDQELSAAGMSRAAADALRNEYLRSTGQLNTGGGGGGGYYGGGGSSTKKTTKKTTNPNANPNPNPNDNTDYGYKDAAAVYDAMKSSNNASTRANAGKSLSAAVKSGAITRQQATTIIRQQRVK